MECQQGLVQDKIHPRVKLGNARKQWKVKHSGVPTACSEKNPHRKILQSILRGPVNQINLRHQANRTEASGHSETQREGVCAAVSPKEPCRRLHGGEHVIMLRPTLMKVKTVVFTIHQIRLNTSIDGYSHCCGQL